MVDTRAGKFEKFGALPNSQKPWAPGHPAISNAAINNMVGLRKFENLFILLYFDKKDQS